MSKLPPKPKGSPLVRRVLVAGALSVGCGGATPEAQPPQVVDPPPQPVEGEQNPDEAEPPDQPPQVDEGEVPEKIPPQVPEKAPPPQAPDDAPQVPLDDET